MRQASMGIPLPERLLPGDDVLVDRVDQRPIESKMSPRIARVYAPASAAVISYGLMNFERESILRVQLVTPESAFQSGGS